MRLLVLLLAGTALAGDASFDDVFDPSRFPEGQNRTDARYAALEAAARARGAAAAVGGFRRCEKSIEELRERMDRDYEAYAKLLGQWWGWRRKFETECTC